MRILISDKIAEQGIEILEREFQVDARYNLSASELIQAIPEYDALVVRSETKVTRSVIQAASRLKVIGRAGVGIDNIDVQAATERGILVLNAPDGNTIAAAEHTVGMMFALARHIPQAHASIKGGQWVRNAFMGVELQGKTLGIIGMGRIGKAVADRAVALGMNILTYDPFQAKSGNRLGQKSVELNEIYCQADFLTVHVPLTPDTKHLLNQEAFAKMKPGIRIINCARGGIIDEQDLYAALQTGKVAGAALDVLEQEPFDPNHPLLDFENVIFTPHLGASTAEAQVGVATAVAKGLGAALRGESLGTSVNGTEILARKGAAK